MDWSPIWISMKTATLSILITFFLGVWMARLVVSARSEKVKMVLDGILTLPMVLPPTVAGFFLLMIFLYKNRCKTTARTAVSGIVWRQDCIFMGGNGDRGGGDLISAYVPGSARRV